MPRSDWFRPDGELQPESFCANGSEPSSARYQGGLYFPFLSLQTGTEVSAALGIQ
jgi:hypothetical protein